MWLAWLSSTKPVRVTTHTPTKSYTFTLTRHIGLVQVMKNEGFFRMKLHCEVMKDYNLKG